MTDLLGSAVVEDLPASESLVEIAQRIAETVAGPAACDVDLHARFPVESLAALREERVLSALVPVEKGGMGATLTDVSDAVRILSRSCAATGSMLGMHIEQLFLLLRYRNTPALRRIIDEVVEEQLLMANANSEVGLGGDVKMFAVRKTI
jgi:acyl-CoA dehydrogenase